MSAATVFLAEKDAEIERLKGIITELAEALADWHNGMPEDVRSPEELNLLTRAREAVK